MGKTTKKSESNGKPVKGQTSITSFFTKQTSKQKSQLFTQVLPGSSKSTSTHNVKKTFKPQCFDSADDFVDDFKSSRLKTNRRPLSPPETVTKKKPTVDFLGEFNRKSNPEASCRLLEKRDDVAAGRNKKCIPDSKISKKKSPECNPLRDKIIKRKTCDEKSLPAIRILESRRVDTIFKTADSDSDNEKHVQRRSPVSPITVIPETPDAATKITKPFGDARSTPARNVSNGSHAALTSSDVSPSADPMVVPETPEADVIPRVSVLKPNFTKISQGDSDAAMLKETQNVVLPTRTKVPDTPPSRRRTNLLSRTRLEDASRKMSTLQASLGRRGVVCKDAAFVAVKAIGQSDDLLDHMLEEYAQSVSRDSSNESLSHPCDVCTSQRNDQRDPGCFDTGLDVIASVTDLKQPIRQSSVEDDGSSFGPDALQEMLEEYAAFSSSAAAAAATAATATAATTTAATVPAATTAVTTAATTTTLLSEDVSPFKTVPHTNCAVLRSPSNILRGRQLSKATRPSSKLSRTFWKNSMLVGQNPSALSSGDHAETKERLPLLADGGNSTLNAVTDLLSEDLFPRLDASCDSTTRRLVLKPSRVKLTTTNKQQRTGKRTALASRTKRSPCKGNSPFAKRPTALWGIFDISPVDDAIDSRKKNPVFIVKKSLFPVEKENLLPQVEDSLEGTNALRCSQEKTREICDETDISDREGNIVNDAVSERTDFIGGVARDIDGPTWECLEPSHGTPSWDCDLNDSLLAAMDMDYPDNSEVKPDSLDSKVTHDFNLLSPFKTVGVKEEISLPPDLNRYKVTDVKTLNGEKVLHLRCLTKQKALFCRLKGTWLGTLVDVGDTVAVHGQFDSSGTCTLDQEHNFLVVHPDLLLAGTTISRSIRCLRRSVLGETFKGIDSASKPMLLGTILHDVFDQAVTKWSFNEKALLEIVTKVSCKLPYLIDMYAVGMTEQNVLDDAQEYVGPMKKWAEQFLRPHPKQSAVIDIKMSGKSQSEKCNLCISSVRDIEETVWSPRLGTKGKLDGTVEVKIHPQKLGSKKSQLIVPLELKTGRQTNSIEHRSQLVLYSLMLRDLHGEAAADLGMLLYLKTGAMLAVPATHMDHRELIHLRNQLADYIRRQVKLGQDGKWMLPRLPPPIEDSFTCGYCSHLVGCSLLQRIEENEGLAGQEVSEAGREFFRDQYSHLTSVHFDYFEHWYLLCSLEKLAIEKKNNTKDIWTVNATDREKSGRGQCLSGLLLARCKHNETKDCFYMTFVRKTGHECQPLSDFQVSRGDRVVASVEGTRRVATCTGFIETLSAEEVIIKSERPISNGNGLVYRLDKDDFYNSMASCFVNLARLMSNEDNALRKNVVDLQEPQFAEESCVPDFAKREVAEILDSLNSDQRTAISSVLRCQDYTLIIGMPGTGKTTTIVALVRILCVCHLSVLLTSYTHSAVDNILLKLAKFGFGMLRLGAEHRVHADLKAFTEQAVLGSTTGVQQLASLFESKAVVATTSLGAKHRLLAKRMFDVCIVDEASQVNQLVCLGPLFHARRFVLVGDHKQLPPLVQSSAARQLGKDVSLLQRLGERHEPTPLAANNLCLQYRMNASIADLTNSLVYEGRLHCGSDRVATATLNLPDWDSFEMECCANQAASSSWVLHVLKPATAVCYLDTNKVKYQEDVNEKRTVNTAEALLVKHLVDCLMKCGCPAEHVGIISPYRNQCRLLDTMLDGDVEVNTVDKYQGRDKEVIIVSFTYTNRESDAGLLLNDLRRLNVALTRAKHKLIMMGSVTALRKYAPMEQLMEYLQKADYILTLPSDACENLPGTT